MKAFLFFIQFSWAMLALGQPYSSSSIFAHNDYVQKKPLLLAYDKQVGFIEADVFLIQGKLLVAHTRIEVDPNKTLESMYLKPLALLVEKTNGYAYPDTSKTLTLMIDLKTNGESTLDALVEALNNYPKLTHSKTLQVAVSGDMPKPDKWINYPSFIKFDGRPGVTYSAEQLARIRLISNSFSEYSSWNGKGELKTEEQYKLTQVIDAAHALGKPMRFWAIPDNPMGWEKLISMKVDILNTDHVEDLAMFLSQSLR
jgi:alkaline phosphatase